MDTYAEQIEAIEDTRAALVARQQAGEDVGAEARAALLAGVRGLLPAWYGTPWSFYGASETPGEGEIACGYLVSTVLRDAGLRVERVALAQQASAHIAATFAGRDVTWFRDRPIDEVLAVAARSSHDLWVVGFDFHVGLLVEHDGRIEFCHASWLDGATVRCEDPRTSAAFVSRVHAIGPVLTDGVVDAWLEGRPIATVR